MFPDHELSDGHTVSHEGDFGLRGAFFLESDIIADLLSEGVSHLIGYSFCEGDGADSSGLGDKDSVILGEEILRDLCGFSWASLTTDDGDFIFFDCVYDLLFVFVDG